MTNPNDFMKGASSDADFSAFPPDITTDRPTIARSYGYLLGGKDNFEIDRATSLKGLEVFPESLDIARENRLFLYRAVRFLAEEAGIDQFLDLGSGLPAENNVHQVAQAVNPDARVIYVDIDPIVLAHGRALLDENSNTTIITADITDPDSIIGHEETIHLIDFERPLGVLLFSIPHCIPDNGTAERTIRAPMARAASGSYLAISHVVSDDPAIAAAGTETATRLGVPWKTRTPGEVKPWLRDLAPVPPGLGDIAAWRPDPDQPPLSPVAEPLRKFVGAQDPTAKRAYEYGGVLRKP